MLAIVQAIGARKGERPSTFERFSRLPIAPLFFVLAVGAGLVGSAAYGARLWVALQAGRSLAENYGLLRQSHAAIQLLIFFGGFISGFLLQAAPRLFEVERIRPLWAVYLLPALLLSLLSFVFVPELGLGWWLLRIYFAALIGVAVTFSKVAPRHTLFRVGGVLVWSLCCFLAATFLDVASPMVAVMIFWCAVVPVIYVAVWRVFWSLAGVREPKTTLRRAIELLYALSVLALICHFAFESSARSACGDLFAILGAAATALMAVSWASRELIRERLSESEPIAVGFWLGMSWMLLGFAALLWRDSWDACLHAWATGLGVNLIFVVSLQIAAALSHQRSLSKPGTLAALLVWQLVPLGRALGSILPLGAFAAWSTALITVVVFLLWGALLVLAAWRVVRTSWQMS